MSSPLPRRTDLTYLRHRRRPSATTATDPPATDPAAAALRDAPRTARRTSAAPVFVPRRTSTGAATVLTAERPSVLLDRVQSGVGALSIRADWDAVEHARLGCAYRLRSGHSTLARPEGPPRPDEPLTLAVRDGVPTIRLDLLRCRHLDRLLVFAVLRHDLLPSSWHGSLRIRTYGGTLVDVPVTRPATPGVLVVLSLHHVAGEFALRAELDHVAGSVRDATAAHGFTGVTRPDGRPD